MIFPGWGFAFLMVGLAYGCWIEWRERRFPKWLSLPILGALVIARVLSDKISFAAWLVTGAVFFLIWGRGYIEGGDLKVMLIISGLWDVPWSFWFLIWWGWAVVLFFVLWKRYRAGQSAWMNWLRGGFCLEAQNQREIWVIPSWLATLSFYVIYLGVVKG
jgi:Flp pilus assembly protein protease CpaA